MMKKRIILWLAFLLCIAVSPRSYAYENFHTEISANKLGINPPYVFTLDPGFSINQNINQQGLVVISGNLKKPFTTDHVKLSIQYQDSQGNWSTAWCKTLYSYNQYNEILNARFELPAQSANSYNLKIELSSDTNISNWNSITWDKSISHYKFGDYNAADCDLDENEYTILLTPKKENTLLTDLASNL